MENPDAPARISPFLPMFETFRAELDEHHDRRERIIKASRDITASSKKIIFALQRVRTLGAAIPNHITKTLPPHYSTITERFSTITADLQSINAYRYYRQVSPGIQEWMESLLFQHYLTTQTLLSFADAASELRKLCTAQPPGQGIKGEQKIKVKDEDVDMDRPEPDNTEQAAVKPEGEVTVQPEEAEMETIPPPTIDLTPEDYLLGVFDMTGELMRFAITSIATSGALPSSTTTSNPSSNPSTTTRTPLTDLQALRQALSTLDYGASTSPFARDAQKKLEVTVQSVEKVERAMYGLVVRGSERPKGWVPSLDVEAQVGEVEAY